MAARPARSKKISAFVVETGWPGVEGRAPLPLHGPEGARQRRDQLQERPRAGREPDRRRGEGAQDRAHHPQRRPPVDPQRLGGHGQALPGDLPHLGERARAVGPAGRQARGDRPQDRRHGGHHLRHGVDRRPGDRDVRPRRLRHPPRSGGLQGVEHRPHLGDRGRHAADPRRPRLRDRDLAAGARRGADRRRADDARLPHQPDLRGLVARSCTCSWPARRWTSTSRWPAR